MKKTLLIIRILLRSNKEENEKFEVRGLELFVENDLVIIDSSGSEVFRTSGYQNDWPPQALDGGTYFYILRIKKSARSKWKVIDGHITLIRDGKG